MKIRMLSTQKGSIDGIRIKEYEVGAEYELGTSPGAADLAHAFIGARMAEAVADVTVAPAAAASVDLEPEIEEMAVEAASENKVKPAVPETKRKGRK